MAGNGQAGNCYCCGAEMSRTGMRTHLLKKHGGGSQLCRLIRVEARYNNNYWLYLDAPVECTLKTLDGFLRKIWLECCGHMSGFFASNGYDEIPMSLKLGHFSDGAKLRYEYDFGDTTELVVTLLGTTFRPSQWEKVRLLARNKPFEPLCGKCGKPAVYIDAQEVYGEANPFVCEECAEEDYECYLPVTNSPRMGVCGYCGELDKYEFANFRLWDMRK